jgi:hypothetical protein
MDFELTNANRTYFGLDPVDPGWEKVTLPGDKYRPVGTLYFDGDTIKRRIISTEDRYEEDQYHEPTRKRSLLLSKTARGKPQELTAAVLEKRQPTGVYLRVKARGAVDIGSYTTQTTFYSTSWDLPDGLGTWGTRETIERFIAESPDHHREQIKRFKTAQRLNVKFKSGDYFALKLDRARYGFGRVLLDITALRKARLIAPEHGLNLAMGHPVVVQLYARATDTKALAPTELQSVRTLPTSLMMDNKLLYGEYEIVGHNDLAEEDFEFPISYGQSIDARRPGLVFLQWGLIHRELPRSRFNKYLTCDDLPPQLEYSGSGGNNPFGFYSIGFSPHYDGRDVLDAVQQGGVFDFDRRPAYFKRLDLRNPRNASFRKEILEAFGLHPEKSYIENCGLTGTPRTVDLLNKA